MPDAIDGFTGGEPQRTLLPLSWSGLLPGLDAGPTLCVIVVGADHRLAFQNAMSRKVVGERPLGEPARVAFPDYPEWVPMLDQVLATGEPVQLRRAPMTATGDHGARRVVFDAVYAPVRDTDGRVAGVLCQAVDVTAQHPEDDLEVRRAAALGRAAVELSRSLDLEQVTETVTRLAADVFDGWCLLDLWQADGTLVRVGGTHHDAAMQHVIDRMIRLPRVSGRPSGDAESIAARVARTGDLAAGRFDPATLASVATGPEHASILVRLRPGPYMIVPVQVGARRLGALSVLRSADREPFDPGDRGVAEQFAERAAIALAHAADYDEQRQAALTLQRSLLPPELSAVPGASVAVRYRAGKAGSEVGGDWYDVFPLDGGSLGVAVGDVQGHDLAAAAVMGQVRGVVHSHARSGQPPAVVAERANEFLTELRSERLVTLAYLQVHPAERLAVWVRAGHMPLVLVAPGETSRVLSGRGGLPLGVDASARWREETVRLPPGALLAMFTDGLVESPEVSFDDGVARLVRVLEAGVDDDLDNVADTVLSRLAAGRGHIDDVALVLLRVTAEAPAYERCVTRQLPAAAASTPIARRFVTDLLPQWGLDAEVTDTAALLVSELVTNASRHSDGHVELRLELREGRLRGGVFDESHRLPELRDNAGDDPAGRGLQVVDRLSSGWGVDTEARGKCVWFELAVPAAGLD